ncbi:MAG: bacillithiol system redox-active protein YtxJ [Flavobacteriales bacterium]|nr:bacillithiol system redox-active protein YtxJ [Flavobacteriales bacterium]
MEFAPLTDIKQLEEIDSESFDEIQVIFKHSTQCGTSFMARRRLLEELRSGRTPFFKIYELDLIRYRTISNYVSSKYGVKHESPQILFIKNGKTLLSRSHNRVSLELDAF